MSAFPAFKSFGSNTNPQGNSNPAAAWHAMYGKKPQAPVGGPKPFTNNPLGSIAGINTNLAGKASAMNKPAKPQSMQAGAVGAGGSVWDRPRVGNSGAIEPYMRDAVAQGLLSDAGTSQKALDFNWQRNEQGRQDFMGQNQRAYDQMSKMGREAGDQMRGDAQEGYDRSVGAADQGYDRVFQRITESEARHEDRTSQDIADLNQGIMSQRASQLSRQIDELGLSGADPNDPQVAQVRADFEAETNRMRQSAATQLISSNNQFRASFEQGNTQILAGMAGDSAQMKMQAAQNLTAYNQQASQFRAAVEGEALQRKLAGDMAGYEMLVQNPYSPMGVAGVLSSIMAMIDSGAGAYSNPVSKLQ